MATSIPFTFATPVTSYQQGMQAGDQLQQNALALAQQRQDASDQNALRQALPSIYTGTPNDQQNALKTLAQTAPNKVPDFNSQLQAMNTQQQQATIAKAQAAMQDLGSLVAIPDGPQREQAYQAVLDREQAQGLDVSQLRGMPANQGIRTVFMKAQTAQQLAQSLQPQTVKLGANEQQISTDPLTGRQTVLSGGGEEKYVNDYNTGRIDPSTGQPILAQGFVGPNGFRPIGLAGSPSSSASGAGGFANPGGLSGAVQTVESGNNPNAVSPAGAQGLMQLLPSTAANPGFGITPAKDNSPSENQRVGQQYLSALLDKYNGNVPLALAAYNAGPGAVDNAVSKSNGNINTAISLLPAETQAYVPKVLQTLQQAQGGAQAGPVNVSDSVPTTATVAPDGTMTAVAQPNAGTTVAAQTGALPGGFYTKAAEQKNAPSGYRFAANGNLEVIPGGPADKGGSGEAIGNPDLSGQEYLNSIQDPALRSLVVQIANGQQQIPKIFRPSKGGEVGPTEIASAVAQYDPSFDQADPASRLKSRNDFTSGQSAKQIQSLNTLLGHLQGLSNAADELHNSGGLLTGTNAVGNYLNTKVLGNNSVTNFNAAAGPAAEEFAALLKGGVPSVTEIEAAKERLNSNMSPEQLNGSIGTIASQVQSRLDALQQRANQGLGPYASKVQILSPEGQKALDTLRAKGLIGRFDVGEPTQPSGPVPNSNAAISGQAQAPVSVPTQRTAPPPAAVQHLQAALQGMSPQQQQLEKAKFDKAFGAGASDAFGKAP